MAEQKLHQGDVDILPEIQKVVEPWLNQASNIDTIVLACTHFPLLKAELNEVFIRHNKHIKWIDSSESIANRVRFLLDSGRRKMKLSEISKESNCAIFTDEMHISDAFQQHLTQLDITQVNYLTITPS